MSGVRRQFAFQHTCFDLRLTASIGFKWSSNFWDLVVGQAPALIREGGSYGGITRHLEEKLQAPAIHFPMGQATDNAHLPNERLRLHNLTQGHDVLYRFFQMQAE
eukprot:INCI14741.7.p2 GENE.INCI14741.7~~INCI14741.7.p2  ORF type:complete len:105 (-),score=14.43 INCI14741.7:32-346(-)